MVALMSTFIALISCIAFVSARSLYPQPHGFGPFNTNGPCRMQFCDYNAEEVRDLDHDQMQRGPALHKIREAIHHCIPAPVNGKTPDALFHKDEKGEVECAVGLGYVANAIACKLPCHYYHGGDWNLYKQRNIPNPSKLPRADGLCSVLASVIPPNADKHHYNNHCHKKSK